MSGIKDTPRRRLGWAVGPLRAGPLRAGGVPTVTRARSHGDAPVNWRLTVTLP